MKPIPLIVMAGLLVGSLAAQAPPQADAIMTAARTALGGDARIAGVKRLIVSGRTRQLRGENLIPIEFVSLFEFPDRYVRQEEVPAQASGPTLQGFNGREAIQPPGPQRGGGGRGVPPPGASPAGVSPPPGAPPPPGAVGRARGPLAADPVTTMKQDVVRLLLGLFASSREVLPVTFASAGTAEAPEGTADAIDVSGPGGFAARVFIGQRDHLPLMVSWRPPAAPPDAPDNRLYFADYRDVNGLKLPYRIRRASGATTTEETTIDRYRVNAKIDPRKFEVKP
jgi:hypothetical protein